MELKRSMVFIDAGNLSGGWWTFCKKKGFVLTDGSGKLSLTKKVNYDKLIKEISKGTDLIRSYYYDSVNEPLDSRKIAFFDTLRSLEITVVTKKLRHKSIQCNHCKKIDFNIPYQKGVDVALVTDLMALAFEKAYDTAIVISGDNDFVDAVNYVKSKVLKVYVASFVHCLGEDMMRSADKVIKLDSVAENIMR